MDFLPGYVTDHDLLLPAAGETETTSNKTLENLLKDRLFGNNEIANNTAANIEQQPSTSSDAAVNPSKQESEALSSPLFSTVLFKLFFITAHLYTLNFPAAHLHYEDESCGTLTILNTLFKFTYKNYN